MQDVLAKLKEIQENYDNEDIQRAITAAKKTAVAEEQVNEDSYDHTSSDGHEIKDVTDYDDYDGYSVKLETPLGTVEAEWNSQGGRGFFGGIRASNRTLESMIGKIYGEMHDFESMDKMDWPVAVGKAVDKVMSMAKDNPSFMRSESVEEAEEQVNEYYVKSAEDVLNTFPLFMYRKSNPSYDKTNQMDQDLAKDFGDEADEAYEMFQQWIAKGNKLSKNQIEMLDMDASRFFAIDPDDDDPIGDMIEALEIAVSSIDDIVNGKVESVEKVHQEEVVEESVYNSDLERMIKLAGRSGVLGMNTNVIIAESVEVAETQVNEDFDDMSPDDLRNAALRKLDIISRDLRKGRAYENDIFSLGNIAMAMDNMADETGEFEDVYQMMHDVQGAIADAAGEMSQGGDATGVEFDSNLRDMINKTISALKATGKKFDYQRMASESAEEDSVEEVHEEEAVEETVEVPVSALQELMKLAGYEQYKIDEYANEPAEEYGSAEDQMDLGGGLNGPKKAYAAAAGGDNPMDQEPTEIEEDNKLTFEGMYKRYMTKVVEETLEEKE